MTCVPIVVRTRVVTLQINYLTVGMSGPVTKNSPTAEYTNVQNTKVTSLMNRNTLLMPSRSIRSMLTK